MKLFYNFPEIYKRKFFSKKANKRLKTAIKRGIPETHSHMGVFEKGN